MSSGFSRRIQLTGRLRRKPYSVVLLDEIEKAHPEVYDLFLQLFDEGRLTDSHGRLVDGQNAIFIMTSNILVEQRGGRQVGFGPQDGNPVVPDSGQQVLIQLRRSFRPEFVNRIDEVVVFSPLSQQSLAGIARNLLSDLARRCQEQHVAIEFGDAAVDLVVRAGFDPANGARALARAIERLVARPIGQCLIAGEIKSGDHIRVDVSGERIAFTKLHGQDSIEDQAGTC